MNKEVQVRHEKKDHELSLVEQVVMQGDLSKLNAEQRVLYYRKVCDSCGLNPFTRPFDYITLNGKLTLYAKKDATEQLRKLNGISITQLESKVIDDLYIVTAIASTKDGRIDQATGAVTIGNLRGDAKANAIMKAETKAKRRVTLSISGMGWTDESEIESLPNASRVDVDLSTGEIRQQHISFQMPIEKEMSNEKAISQDALNDFYANFSDNEETTRVYFQHVMKQKKCTEEEAIKKCLEDLPKWTKLFNNWRDKNVGEKQDGGEKPNAELFT